MCILLIMNFLLQEKRKLYDSGIEHIKENYDELNKLLKNLHEKMAQVANTIRYF